MKKHYFSSIVAATLLATSAQAQVASLYSFSQQSGTYNAITGGTVFGTTSSDDQSFVDQSVPAGGGTNGPGINIGFNFMFNTNMYNRIGVQNNGWISFGHSSFTPAVDMQTGSNYTGLSATSTAPGVKQNRVAGLARDIQAQTGASLRVETIGSAPSRTCVIQWSNYKKFGTGGTGDNFNFQIRLMETTNIVEVAYGTFSNNATSSQAEVGLRGNSNADFNNRIVTTANPWNASIAGTANTSAAAFDATLVPSSGQRYIWTPAQCSGSFSNLVAISSPTLVCPNYGGTVSVVATSTLSGITYTWYESDQSAVGQWTLIPGAEAPLYITPGISSTRWYQAALTCLNSSSSATTSAAEIQVALTTTAAVPYHEGFEGIPVANVLPNCSWFAAGLGTSFQTYTTSNTGNRVPRTGTKFGAFTAPTSTNYVYTNGVQLEPGITYSAALYYATDFAGNSNWTDLSILMGTAQSATGLFMVAGTSPAISGSYKLLSGTFTVGASGLYYMAIRATGGTAGAPYLMIDDVSITIPCTPESGNSPTVTAFSNAQSACLGQPLQVNAGGADVYQWSDNNSGSSANVIPGQLGTNTFVVLGTRTLTGCSATASLLVNVFAPPVLNVVASPPIVCAGKPVVLTASGANVYNWSNGGNVAQIVVSPPSSANFVVIGTSTNNCTSSANVSVTVLPLPAINASATRTTICVGESTSLMASGGASYMWTSLNTSNILQGATVTVLPGSSDTYTVVGTDANGCQNTAMTTVAVDLCAGLYQTEGAARFSVYPNPSTGVFMIEGLTPATRVTISDVSGRVLLLQEVSGSSSRVDISGFAAGIYYINTDGRKGNASGRIIKE